MKSEGNNKSFGILFFTVFLLIGLWPLIKGENPRLFFLLLAGFFLVLGLLNSKLLTPLNKTWVKLGELLGRVIAPIIMAGVYFIVLTPTSFLVRFFGKDLLNLKFSKKIKSYWLTRKKDIGSMKKQF